MSKKSKTLMKIVNIDEENLHIFRKIWRMSMTFSGKMCLMIILKVTKKQGFTLSLEDTVLKNSQGGSHWPPSLLKVNFYYTKVNAWSPWIPCCFYNEQYQSWFIHFSVYKNNPLFSRFLWKLVHFRRNWKKFNEAELTRWRIAI